MAWLWIVAAVYQGPARPPHTRAQYAGVESCRACHERQVRSFLATAHSRSTQVASRDSIVAPFGPTAVMVASGTPDLQYRLETKDGGFFQSTVRPPASGLPSRTERIELVIGSGRRGQTYLWWRNDELFQFPLSYWNELKTWAYAPGITDRTATFNRPVPPRCLDCHSTYFESRASDTNRYDRTTALLGVSCEKCHGPGGDHVAARRADRRRAAPAGLDVVNPARLQRDGRVDVCASCHGGQTLGPPFSYVPGDPVRRPPVLTAQQRNPARGGRTLSPAGIDSHGQQAAGLLNSRCFQRSEMTCETCHDPHVAQTNIAAFNAKCLSCHKVEACGRFARDGRAIAGRCVDCHMPLQPSRLIVSTNAAGTAQASLRSHVIAVYDQVHR